MTRDIKDLIVALDIGTSKVAVIDTATGSNGRVSTTHRAQAPSLVLASAPSLATHGNATRIVIEV